MTQRALREHIAYLEEKIDALKTQTTNFDRTEGEKREAQIDLGIAERALVHFQKAFELERESSLLNRFADSEVPSQSQQVEVIKGGG